MIRRLLLVEDTDAHARLVQRYIEQFVGDPITIERAVTLQAGLDCLRSSPFDAVLLDLSLPDSAWQDTLTVMVEAAPTLPIVVLTSVGDVDLAADAVHRGADGYVVKSEMDANVLYRALRYAAERKKVSEISRRRTEELERSNEALRHFAHTMAHEFRQPLNSLSLHSGMMRLHLQAGEDAMERAADSLANIEASVKEMSTMMDDLLRFASDRNAGEDAVEIALEDVVRQVCDDLAPEIEEADADVACSDLGRVHAHPRYLRHILRNLISNAIKYRSERKPEIRIEMKEGAEEVEVSVTDNGTGIPADERHLLFEMFKRLASTAQVEGNGIGLALCRRLVEGQGGTLGVESEPGVGSRFYFTLPRKAPDPAALTE